MKHGSLFSGIGGFDLAAEWMGWENVFHCEWNEFGKKVLNYYWPESISYHDITKTDFTIHRGGIDILTGGFPCQPFSGAGKRKGTDDNRYLWPEYLRTIREVKPTFVIGENVAGILSMGEREVFAKVEGRSVTRFADIDKYEAIYTRQEKMLVNSICEDLEKEGYHVQPFIIPAAGVGAPHRRDRIWFIAYANHHGQYGSKNGQSNKKGDDCGKAREEAVKQFKRCSCEATRFITNPNSSGFKKRQLDGSEISGSNKERRDSSNNNSKAKECCNATNAKCNGRHKRRTVGKLQEEKTEKRSLLHEQSKRLSQKQDVTNTCSCGRTQNNQKQQTEQFKQDIPSWRNFPTQSPVCDGDDGLSSRLDSITFPKWRSESIKAGGNAIVPQIAFQIFKAIDKMTKTV